MSSPHSLLGLSTKPVKPPEPAPEDLIWKDQSFRLLSAEQDLEASHRRYLMLYDSAPVGCTILDKNGCIQSINLTGAKILGHPREKLIACPLFPLVARPDQRRFLRHLSAVSKGTTTHTCELRFHRPDQTERVLQLASRSTPGDHGHPCSIWTVLADVTAQRRLEAESDENRAELAAITSSASFAIIAINVDLRIVHFNAAAERMFCCPASEAAGQSLSRFIPEYAGEAWKGRLRRFALTGQCAQESGREAEIRAVRAGGAEFFAFASISRVDLPHKKLLTVMLWDLTPRKEVEEALQRTVQRLELAQKAARLSIFEWDLQRNSIDCSPSTREFYGVPPGTFHGPCQTWWRSVHPEDARRIRKEMRDSLKHEDYLDMEFRIVRPNNKQVRWIQSRSRVIRDGQGRPCRLMGVEFDITHRKRLEELNRQNHKILERRVAERTAELSAVNAALDHEIDKRRRLQQRLLEISEREQQRIGQDLHDGLGQLMSGAALLGDVLKEKLAKKSLPEKADARRLAELLAESRAQARQLAHGLRPVPVAANGLALALGELSRVISRLYGVRCRFHLRGRVCLPNNVAATHLFRIAQEAANNAVRHGHSKRITLTLASREGSIRLAIRDNGRGIHPSGPKKRNGLGLQIMESRCEAVGASLKIRRVRPRGTLVECLMPTGAHPSTRTEV